MSRKAEAQIAHFQKAASARHGLHFDSYAALHRWSVTEPDDFWSLAWDEFSIIGERSGPTVEPGREFASTQFFPMAELNYAENLLAHGKANPDQDALIFWGENLVSRRLTWMQLEQAVSIAQQAILRAGLKAGDRVAAMLPNCSDAIIFMLAAASIGAIWSSCSPDFGAAGILERFSQIGPKLMLGCDRYLYDGKWIDTSAKFREVTEALEDMGAAVLVPYDAAATNTGPDWCLNMSAFTAGLKPAPLRFERLPFNHPLFVMFSSGTTGKPKCILHGAGGTLIQHIKEHRLHYDLHPGDRFFYFTTCGWMMWNWLASGLASGTTLCLYDGSPLASEGDILFDFAEKERITFFGTSAKFLDTIRKSGRAPAREHDLSSIRTLTSTGSPLSPASFAFAHAEIAPQAHLASLSGGTDIISCFVGGVPTLPVFAPEIQAPGLGMAVDIWDESGRPSAEGELVCTRPFPSMPLGFWNDPDGSRYRAAYFETFPSIWCHGDFAKWGEHGGMIILGRSDATLNPGGVRIGTAELYNAVLLLDEVEEALAIGQNWQDDVRIVLFVRLRPGEPLSAELEKRIRLGIRQHASPRHVPARILAVPDIPRTKSGKLVELAVRDVVHGRPVKNLEALANPESLSHFAGHPELSI